MPVDRNEIQYGAKATGTEPIKQTGARAAAAAAAAAAVRHSDIRCSPWEAAATQLQRHYGLCTGN